MEFDERIWTTYEERIENSKWNYEILDTVTLWNEFVAADDIIMEYFYGAKFTGSKAASYVGSGKERRLFEAFEDSNALLQLLKKREKKGIRMIDSQLKNEFNSINDELERGRIEGLLGLIEEELLKNN